jgi:hypothetical protein
MCTFWEAYSEIFEGIEICLILTHLNRGMLEKVLKKLLSDAWN